MELELRRKLLELGERYTVRAELRPLTLLRIELPVLAVECKVYRRQACRTHTVYWNPLTKNLEPLCCAGCGASIFTMTFTDDDVAPLCAACS